MKILAVLLKLVNWLVDWSPGRAVESAARLSGHRTNKPTDQPANFTRSILWMAAGRLRVLEVPA